MNRLAFLSPTEVSALSRHEREERVRLLVHQSQNIVTRAVEGHVNADGRALVATVVLFSGGNDSTVLAHLMRDRATHAAHANTTIGLEATREFVRRSCAAWALPLLEFTPPRTRDHYENLVIDQGFPGPGHHFKMYQRLKERSLEEVRRQLVHNPYRERVIFLAGRRRTESARRATIPAVERRGSTVWVSPLVNWTNFDLTTYRLLHADVPVNDVTNLIHMSGECLCGSFAKPGEREEIAFWFPSFEDHIQELEERVSRVAGIPDHRRRWGWGATLREPYRQRGPSGPMCSSCDARFSPSASG